MASIRTILLTYAVPFSVLAVPLGSAAAAPGVRTKLPTAPAKKKTSPTTQTNTAPGEVGGLGPSDPCPTAKNCDPSDLDKDEIPDAWEDKLAVKFAPELRLPPPHRDWTRPASVDWYLPRVQMRFDHTNCPDHQIVAKGDVTQANLGAQRHRFTGALCKHTGDLKSSTAEPKFFLQPSDDVHKGASKEHWRTYVHVKESDVGAYDVQYWFFYAYNDSVGPFNHEGDWEHITVTTDAAGNFVSAHYGQHEGGHSYTKSDLMFVHDNHPVVYVADGSHACYPRVGSHDIPNVPGFDDHTYSHGPVWETWKDWVNVGEKNHPRNGQLFLRYAGRWGEIGNTDVTSGPFTPSFQPAWNAR